jgi:hypothetical protein
MTRDERARARVRPLAFVALGVSVVVAGAWWFYGLQESSDTIIHLFGYDAATPIALLLLMTLVAIAVDVAAGWRGGIGRAVGIVAGIILASPLGLMVFSAFFPDYFS